MATRCLACSHELRTRTTPCSSSFQVNVGQGVQAIRMPVYPAIRLRIFVVKARASDKTEAHPQEIQVPNKWPITNRRVLTFLLASYDWQHTATVRSTSSSMYRSSAHEHREPF